MNTKRERKNIFHSFKENLTNSEEHIRCLEDSNVLDTQNSLFYGTRRFVAVFTTAQICPLP
jgi:hypothetical protein